MPNFYAKTPFCPRCWEVFENSVTRKNPNGCHISLDFEPQFKALKDFFTKENPYLIFLGHINRVRALLAVKSLGTQKCQKTPFWVLQKFHFWWQKFKFETDRNWFQNWLWIWILTIFKDFGCFGLFLVYPNQKKGNSEKMFYATVKTLKQS